MYKRKASVAPDHPRRTGQFRVERWECHGAPWRKCGSDYRRTIVLDCRSKGDYLAVHSQKGKTRRWLCSSFSAEREVLDVQEERVYRTRLSGGDWSVPRRALAMPQ